MKLGKLNSKTLLISTLIASISLPILLSLGIWQIKRAEEKSQLQSEYDMRRNDKPVKIEGHLQQLESLRFHNVEVQGYYEYERQMLVDNRIHKGKVGYYVVTPLRIKGSNLYILVNRGWVPMGESRNQLPNVQGSREIQFVSGLATVPLKNRYQFHSAIINPNKWDPLWQYIDMGLYEKVSGLSIQPVIILLNENSDAEGYVRKWQRLDTGIAVHQGYAFQWFSLFVAFLAIYIFVNVRAYKPKSTL